MAATCEGPKTVPKTGTQQSFCEKNLDKSAEIQVPKSDPPAKGRHKYGCKCDPWQKHAKN